MRLITTLATTLLLAGFQQAQAATPYEAVPASHRDSVALTLEFSDLDLRLPADAQKLLQRLKVAAMRACRRNDDFRDLRQQQERSDCEALAYENAVSHINARRRLDIEQVAAR